MSDTNEPDASKRDMFSNWVCPYCGALNQKYNTKCRNCKK
jgi:ribosomal protein L40E